MHNVNNKIIIYFSFGLLTCIYFFGQLCKLCVVCSEQREASNTCLNYNHRS